MYKGNKQLHTTNIFQNSNKIVPIEIFSLYLDFSFGSIFLLKALVFNTSKQL